MKVSHKCECALPNLDRAKWTFTTRRVDRSQATGLSRDFACAKAGDLVVAEVAKIANHKRAQLSDGRYSTLFVGDRLVLACADRYATDQFCGRSRLAPEGASLLAGGGVIGELTEQNERVKTPTRLIPLGLIKNSSGQVINLASFSLEPVPGNTPHINLLIVGTGMNAGKTTAAAGAVNGCSRLGLRTTAIKLTGTGSFGDLHAYDAAGADRVLDFTDAGMASTHRQPLEDLLNVTDLLLSAAAGTDISICELADGITQVETAELLANPKFRSHFDGVLLAAPDPLAAEAALARLQDLHITPLAITGRITSSQSNAHEWASQYKIPILSWQNLCDPSTASALCSLMQHAGGKAA